MSWRELFERAGGHEVTVDDVRESTARRREDGEDGGGAGVGTGAEGESDS